MTSEDYSQQREHEVIQLVQPQYNGGLISMTAICCIASTLHTAHVGLVLLLNRLLGFRLVIAN
jgi:hypothetical protein